MPSRHLIRILLPVMALAAMIAASACGTVATPEWAAEAQATRVAQAATDEHLTAVAPTFTPSPAPTETPIPPTATPVPPTATPVPPTETPVPPTATTAPVEEHTDEHSAAGEEPNPDDLAAALAAGNPDNGKVVFETPHDTANGTWACAQCHSVTPDEMRIIGPGLWNVSVHGATHIAGMSALEYIHQSIVDPNAYIVPDEAQPYPPGLMPTNWEEVLTPQELNDVIAYLFTLHD